METNQLMTGLFGCVSESNCEQSLDITYTWS